MRNTPTMPKPKMRLDDICITDCKALYDAIEHQTKALAVERQSYRSNKAYLSSLYREKRKIQRIYRDYALIKRIVEQDPESLLYALRQGIVKLTSYTRLSMVSYVTQDTVEPDPTMDDLS